MVQIKKNQRIKVYLIQTLTRLFCWKKLFGKCLGETQRYWGCGISLLFFNLWYFDEKGQQGIYWHPDFWNTEITSWLNWNLLKNLKLKFNEKRNEINVLFPFLLFQCHVNSLPFYLFDLIGTWFIKRVFSLLLDYTQ